MFSSTLLFAALFTSEFQFEFKRVTDINLIQYDGAGSDKSALLRHPIILQMNAETNKHSIAVSGYFPHSVEKDEFESFRNTIEEFAGRDMTQDLTISLTGTNIHFRKKRIQFKAQIDAVGRLELTQLFKQIDRINAKRQKTKLFFPKIFHQPHLYSIGNRGDIGIVFGDEGCVDPLSAPALTNCDDSESTKSAQSELEEPVIEPFSPVPSSTASECVTEPSSPVHSPAASERVIEELSPLPLPTANERVMKLPSPVPSLTGSERVTIATLPPNPPVSVTPSRLVSPKINTANPESPIYRPIPALPTHIPQLYNVVHQSNPWPEENHTISMYKFNVNQINQTQKQCPIYEKYWGKDSKWKEYGTRKEYTVITPAPLTPTPVQVTQKAQSVQFTRNFQNMKIKRFGEHFYVQKTAGLPFAKLDDEVHGGKQAWINGERFFIDAAEWQKFLQTNSRKL